MFTFSVLLGGLALPTGQPLTQHGCLRDRAGQEASQRAVARTQYVQLSRSDYTYTYFYAFPLPLATYSQLVRAELAGVGIYSGADWDVQWSGRFGWVGWRIFSGAVLHTCVI